MMYIVLMVIGFLLLIKGADMLVDGASSLAKKMKVSDIVIGLTIVSFGTSAPELIVNIFSAVTGNTDIAVGNVIGSNIANILLILGLSAIVAPLVVNRNTLWKEIPLSILAVAVILFMINDPLLDQSQFSGIVRSEGLILLMFFIIFIVYVFSIIKKEEIEEHHLEKVKIKPVYLSVLFIIAGLAGLVVGGKWIVDGAVRIAEFFNINQTVIGLTIVAIGTSLPEIATSVIASYKGKSDIAVGNVIGSNLFNIFWILGVSSVIRPLPVRGENNQDVIFLLFASFLLMIFILIGRKQTLKRWQGIVFVVLYGLYVIWLVYRSMNFRV